MSKYNFKFILDGTTDITDKIKSFEIESSLDSYCRELSFDTFDQAFFDTLDFSSIPRTPRIEVFTSIEEVEEIIMDEYDVNYLILNFEGANGSTEWTEEAQGLIPSAINSESIIDTSIFFSGTSSLKIINGYVDYDPIFTSEFTGDFYYNLKFMLSSDVDYVDLICFWGNLSDIEVYANNSTELTLQITDKTGTILVNTVVSYSWNFDKWYDFAVEVIGNVITVSIGDILIGSWESLEDRPFSDLTGNEFYNGGTPPCWYDSVLITGSKPSILVVPDWISQGTFFIERPTFQVGINETTTGIWGRQSTAVLGEPFAQKVTQLWSSNTSFYGICQDIVESVGLVWNPLNCDISDFTVYADNFESDDQYPIEALQSLVELIVGEEGFVTSDRLGNICVKRLSRTPITIDYNITDLVVQSINEEPEWPEFGNRIKIIPSESASQDTIEISLSSECIGMSTDSSFIEVFAQVKDGEGVPINDAIVTWKFSPVNAECLGYMYPVSGTTFQKEVYQNSSNILISKEVKRASGVRIVETAFDASSVVGIWAYADKTRTYNFGAACVIDGKKIYITQDEFDYCDQMVVISYYASGMVSNVIWHDASISDPGGDITYGEALVIASLSGKETTKDLYINNNCKCASSLTVTALPTTIEVGQVSTITAYVENSGIPIAGTIRMVEMSGKGTLQWSSRATSTTLVSNEKAEAVNSISGVTQCNVSSGITSVVGVYKTLDDDTPNTSVNYYSSFNGRVIDLNTFINTGTNLMVSYYRAGSVVNYLTGIGEGTSQVVTSLDVNTEEGLSQATSITVNAVPVIIVPDPGGGGGGGSVPVPTYIVMGPTLITSSGSGLDQYAGPYKLGLAPNGDVSYPTNISVSGNGYLKIVSNNMVAIGGNAWGQSITITAYATVGGVQVSATLTVTLQIRSYY